MKISLILTALILILTAIASNHYDRRISASETNLRRTAFTQTASFRSRDPHDADQKDSRFAASLLDDIKTHHADPANRSLEKSIQERLIFLTPRQAKAVLDLLANTTVPDPFLHHMVATLSLTKLASAFPLTTLQLLPRFISTEGIEIQRQTLGEEVVSTALIYWAQDDPLAAVDWLQTANPLVDSFVTEKVRLKLLSATASKDPALAFQLIDQLSPENPAAALPLIVRTASGPQKRTLTLGLTRSYLAALDDSQLRQDLLSSTIETLAKDAFQDGFSSASRWASSNLQDEELIRFSTTIRLQIPYNGEAPEWIAWQHGNLPAETAASNIRQIVADWTLADHQAVGQWLIDSPPGEVRDIATEAYLETATPYLSSHPTLAPILSELQNL